MTMTLTEKQRRGMEAFEGARRAGMALSDYAKMHRLVVRELYDAIDGLRKRGLLPVSERSHKRKQPFVAVKVVSSAARIPELARTGARGGMVCRLLHASGLVIECGEWPPPSWLSAVMAERRDAAP